MKLPQTLPQIAILEIYDLAVSLCEIGGPGRT